MNIALRLPPGVMKNGTDYQSRGRWRDANLMRFFEGAKRPVGGWELLPMVVDDPVSPISGDVLGVIRSLLAWQAEGAASPYLAVGTNEALYIYSDGVLTDRSPDGLVPGGVETVFGVGGYGTGAYGAGAFGTGSSTAGTVTPASVWSLDTFGNFLVAVLAPSDGTLYYWDGSAGQLVEVPNAPTQNSGVVVTGERFIVALGAGGNPRRVEWATQETLDNWTPSALNSAGGFTLPGAGALVCGRRTKNETLLWTTEDVWAMQYIGGELVYSFQQQGAKCGPASPNAVATADGKAVWMSRRGFFIYDGFVRPVPSEVGDAVFSDFNVSQAHKCFAVARPDFKEVWFHYPSALSQEPDKYVIWNYVENHWTTGLLSRTAGIDRGVYEYPIYAATDALYEHEKGTTHAGAAAAPFLSSGPIELGDGDAVMVLRQLVPDEATRAGQVLGSARVTVYARMYPTSAERAYGPYSLANPTPVRITARQVRLVVEEVTPGTWWLGDLRVEAVPGGGR